jgi:soluble lytic murein transglycosylase
LRSQVLEARHPLAPWVDYWELSNRLFEVSTPEVEAFNERWPGSYVEDRLRNDWLLELGRRRDWPTFARVLPRFRMNDDREVSCYALLAEQAAGHEVSADAARRAWMSQKDADNGCQAMAQAFLSAKLFGEDDVWRKLRHTIEHNRQRQARATASLLEEDINKPLGELLDNPARYLARKASALGRHRGDLTALALARLASNDPEASAKLLAERWAAVLSTEQTAWAWAITARQGGLALHPQSLEWSRKAWASLKKRDSDDPDWSDETLAWHARVALRLGQGSDRWALALRAIDAMSTAERNEPVWQYWRARCALGLAKPGPSGESQRQEARQILAALAPQLGYYGQLASEDLGNLQPLPPRPAPITAPERDGARSHPGLQRALLLLGAGLRPEALREWNYSLIGMSDRQLLATAQFACEREVWDRCVNSSEKTRAEFDMEQRFPMPLRGELMQRSADVGLDPAYAYGLIRQESRFIMDARSHAGASGLMQIMPATAKWTAKKIGLSDFKPAQLSERDVNLRLGTAYLKLVLDDFSGSQALAAAAYNAGPGRPRRWREGPVLDATIWVENVPFIETRDYVKKVLSNATYYAALMSGKPASLRARLGSTIGPRDASVPEASPDLP